MQRLLTFGISVAMLATLGTSAGSADDQVSARIKSGIIFATYNGTNIQGGLRLEGTDDFSLDSSFDGGTTVASCGGFCEAGQTISLSSDPSPTFFGTAAFRGQAYVLDSDAGGGRFWLDAPSFTLPPAEAGPAEVTTPFVLRQGSFLSFSDPSLRQPAFTMTGSGTVTARYMVDIESSSGKSLYFFESIQYNFANDPTPPAR